MNPYKTLSSEWGSKARKEDSRSAKSALRKPSEEDMEEVYPTATWFVLLNATNTVLGVYGSALLSAAQETRERILEGVRAVGGDDSCILLGTVTRVKRPQVGQKVVKGFKPVVAL
jgi:hypothetical protein